jgi:hypothetical protein
MDTRSSSGSNRPAERGESELICRSRLRRPSRRSIWRPSPWPAPGGPAPRANTCRA